MIQEYARQNAIFRIGQGYIYLISKYDIYWSSRWKNIWRSYITAQFIELDDLENDPVFPPFYAYVAGRLVLVHMSMMDDLACYRYSRKSKKALVRKLELFMPPTSKEVARYIETGKVAFRDRKFRLTRFSLHNGKYIYFYTDKPPKVFNDSYWFKGLSILAYQIIHAFTRNIHLFIPDAGLSTQKLLTCAIYRI